MKKIAFFVEGQTEQIFVDRLVREILGKNNVSIILKRSQGGANVPKQELVRRVEFVHNPSWQALIYDCGSDNRVKSAILENLPNLLKAGYSFAVGLRDLYPLQVKELSQLKAGLKFLPSSKAKRYAGYFQIVVAVQEIETWFLAENHHFRRVDKRLTAQFINNRLGFNPFAIDPQERRHPSRDLDNIYRLVGRGYSKRYMQVLHLVKKLDYDHILRHLRYSIPSLGELIGIVERLTGQRR
jgi:hypothetical protein